VKTNRKYFPQIFADKIADKAQIPARLNIKRITKKGFSVIPCEIKSNKSAYLSAYLSARSAGDKHIEFISRRFTQITQKIRRNSCGISICSLAYLISRKSSLIYDLTEISADSLRILR
jgi:hypothetical protein